MIKYDFTKDLTSFLANPPHIRVNVACTVNCHPCEEIWSWFSTKEFNEQKNKVGTCLKKAIIFLKSLIDSRFVTPQRMNENQIVEKSLTGFTFRVCQSPISHSASISSGYL